MSARVAGSLLVWLAMSACSKPAAAPAPDTCLALRLCAFECADDACVAACRAKGSAAALAAFDVVQSCTRQACPTVGDVTCACTEQCLADGVCLDAVAACLGAAPDAICDNLCP